MAHTRNNTQHDNRYPVVRLERFPKTLKPSCAFWGGVFCAQGGIAAGFWSLCCSSASAVFSLGGSTSVVTTGAELGGVSLRSQMRDPFRIMSTLAKTECCYRCFSRFCSTCCCAQYDSQADIFRSTSPALRAGEQTVRNAWIKAHDVYTYLLDQRFSDVAVIVTDYLYEPVNIPASAPVIAEGLTQHETFKQDATALAKVAKIVERYGRLTFEEMQLRNPFNCYFINTEHYEKQESSDATHTTTPHWYAFWKKAHTHTRSSTPTPPTQYALPPPSDPLELHELDGKHLARTPLLGQRT